MLDPHELYKNFVSQGIRFFTGVPDSLLKDFCAYVDQNVPSANHMIAANEGNAIALAAGHYLATAEPACVYLQNSGLGNAINPLISLVDKDVYSIPMLLLIGWRGEPGMQDEPQHEKQGAVTCGLLDTLSLPNTILPQTPKEARLAIERAVATMKDRQSPYALVVRRGTFVPYSVSGRAEQKHLLRERAIHTILDSLPSQDIVVATTGKTSRELFEYREKKGQDHGKDFLTVGSMGHASSIALGIALAKPEKAVWCLDGDGALIMHMGALAVIGQSSPKNLTHVVLNNGAHESVGGQPTAGFMVDFCAIAQSCGYQDVYRAESEDQLKQHLRAISTRKKKGPGFLEIRLRQGARENLGRPTFTPKENKKDFMAFLEED